MFLGKIAFATRRAFRYIFARFISPRSKMSVVRCPLSVVRKCSQRMPLQSLTHWASSNELRALGKTAHNS